MNPNRVEAAYMRSDLLGRRRELMEEWSNFLATRGNRKRPEAPNRVDKLRHVT